MYIYSRFKFYPRQLSFRQCFFFKHCLLWIYCLALLSVHVYLIISFVIMNFPTFTFLPHFCLHCLRLNLPRPSAHASTWSGACPPLQHRCQPTSSPGGPARSHSGACLAHQRHQHPCVGPEPRATILATRHRSPDGPLRVLHGLT